MPKCHFHEKISQEVRTKMLVISCLSFCISKNKMSEKHRKLPRNSETEPLKTEDSRNIGHEISETEQAAKKVSCQPAAWLF